MSNRVYVYVLRGVNDNNVFHSLSFAYKEVDFISQSIEREILFGSANCNMALKA